MTRAALGTTVALPGNVVFRNIQGEAVVLDVSNGCYFGLDPVGTRMWTLLVESMSAGRVAEVICDEYGVERMQVEQDVLELIDLLADKGLVQLLPSGSDHCSRVERGECQKRYARPRLTERGRVARLTRST